METRHVIILWGLLGLTSGAGVLPDSVDAVVGGNVTFNTSLPPTQTPFISITWQTGTKNIITSNTGNFSNPEYEDRIILFISTGSLQLRSVAHTDEGTYRVTIIPSGSAQLVGTTTLRVYAPVSNVRVTVNDTDLVEFNDSVSLSCSASGSSPLSFLWLNHSSELTDSDRVHLTDGNTTLTIMNVSYYERGPFRCHVFSPVSSGTSREVYLPMSYGPYNIVIRGPTELKVGQSLVLSCSADATPEATYSWTVNGEKRLNNSEVLVKARIEWSDSGKYICEASNSVTGRSLSGEHNFTVQGSCLPDGAIAGMVIACMVIVGVAVGVGVHFYHMRK